jgi:hypothetical protein
MRSDVVVGRYDMVSPARILKDSEPHIFLCENKRATFHTFFSFLSYSYILDFFLKKRNKKNRSFYENRTHTLHSRRLSESRILLLYDRCILF